MTRSPQRILFLCTGNYYRSRFAEAVFNHEAVRRGLGWRAFSRGLGVHLVNGDLSFAVAQALAARGIGLDATGPTRVALVRSDLEAAARIVALKESEHRLLIREQFPDWEDRVTYWNVHDVDTMPAAQALPEIESLVCELVASLGATTHAETASQERFPW